MVKWEYRWVAIGVVGGHIHHSDEDEKTLNDLGADGWELFSVTPLVAEAKTTCLMHHFRRSRES
ncbi:MAG: DUF4177 domain-containing protein [Candidatus Hydrogenedentes bacterium]|nr:DUF4177 domain-containing protein [Candidatus Hydrogenedentota bacterium]